ncbi:hypothetical protein ACP3P8_19020 [Pseudomonas aeruginosa]
MARMFCLDFYVSDVSGTSAVAFSGTYSSDSGVFVDLPVTGQMELEANGASSGVVNISQAGVTITPNSSNTKSTHRFVVSVARGERPFVDGVIYWKLAKMFGCHCNGDNKSRADEQIDYLC